jgi:hypothetical protein
VVDEEAAPDCGSGVDFYASGKPRKLGDDARQKRNSGKVEAMRQTMQEDGVKAGVTQDDLERTLRGGILAKYSVELFPYPGEHVNWMIPTTGRLQT